MSTQHNTRPIPDCYSTIHERTQSGTSRVNRDQSSSVELARGIWVIGMVELIWSAVGTKSY